MYLRDLVDADQLLFIIREYYDLEGEGQEEEEELHRHLRPYLLLILKAYFTKVKTVGAMKLLFEHRMVCCRAEGFNLKT